MLHKLFMALIWILEKPIYAWWRLMGWDYVRNMPDLDKFMLVFAPHTSNIDYFHSIPVAFRVRRHPAIMMKKEVLDVPVIGWFLRLGGGFGVDRSKSHNTVQEVVNYIQSKERIVMIIAPEGTRGYTTDWKTGFYHIAVGANLPLVLVYLNYEKKRAGFSPVYHPTGDIATDFQWMSDFFAEHAHPKHPDRFGLPEIPQS